MAAEGHQLTYEDLRRLARMISPINRTFFATKYLEMSLSELDFICANGSDQRQSNFEMLRRWRDQGNASREDLFFKLENASGDGLLDRTTIQFLMEEAEKPHAHTEETEKTHVHTEGSRLNDKDLWRVAGVISPRNMSELAILYLDMNQRDLDFIYANVSGRTALQYHFHILHWWRDKRNPSRENLYQRLENASGDGLLDRTTIQFLMEEAEKPHAHTEETEKTHVHTEGSRLNDKDLWRVAGVISPINISTLAIHYLDINHLDLDFIYADASGRTALQYHFHMLHWWRDKRNPSRENLYQRLENASDEGFIDKAEIQFLLEEEDDGQTDRSSSFLTHLPQDQLEAACKKALKDGKARSYRARINVIGHSGAGKTTLIRRLLGKHFVETQTSTDGIDIHLIKFDRNSEEFTKAWEETQRDTDDILRPLNKEVLSETRTFARERTEGHNMPTQASATKTPLGYAKIQKPKVESGDKTPAEISRKEDKGKATNNFQLSGKILDAVRKSDASKNRNLQQEGKLCLWDFGGQTEYYGTHHMFLDPNALNIIVLDISKDLKTNLRKTTEVDGNEKDSEGCQDQSEEETENAPGSTAGIPNTQEDFLFFWIQTILSKATAQKIEPQIAIVMTHKDLIPSENKKKYEDIYVGEVLTRIRRLGLSQLITKENIYVVDNKEGSQIEFADLRKQLVKAIEKQIVLLNGTEVKIWGLETPARWLKLQADLFEAIEAKRHITREEVNQIALTSGVQGDELESFLVFCHSLGDLVYFPEEQLQHVIITHPQWLVDVFKVLICPQEFLKKRGVDRDDVAMLLKYGTIAEKCLTKIWRKDAQFFTDLMVKFKLILPLISIQPERRFLIPCMLPMREVCLEETPPFKTMLRVYKAKHQARQQHPTGAFSRLMASCSEHWNITEDKHLSYRYASFEVENGLRLALTHPHNSEVGVSLWTLPGADRSTNWKSILAVRTKMAELLSNCYIPQNQRFQVICPHRKSGDKGYYWVTMKELPETKEGQCGVQPVTDKCPCHGKRLTLEDFKTGEAETPSKITTSGHQMPLGATGDAASTVKCQTRRQGNAGTRQDLQGAGIRVLTDRDVHQTALQLTNPTDITALGVELEVAPCTIDAALYNFPRDIQQAAHQVLQDWRATVATPDEAYETLGQALVKCNLVSIAKQVLDYE